MRFPQVEYESLLDKFTPYMAMCRVMYGKNMSLRVISRAFRKNIPKDDYDKEDSMGLIRRLVKLQTTPLKP